MQWRRAFLAGAAAIVMAMILAVAARGFSIVSHAESAAKVTATSANIRREPNPNSETIGSSEKDKVISIKSQVQGTDGYTWYEVYVDANTLGYIRSDLVQITDGTTPPTGTAPAASTPTPASAATPIPDEPLVDVAAVNPASASVIGGDSVRIRQNASTTSRIVTKVKTGMALTITGTATGKDNKTWYQVTFSNNGTEVTGFIRSDYTTVKPEELTAYTEEPPAEEPPVEEPPVEEPEPATTEGYGIVLQNGQWWLIDYEGKHTDNPGEGFEVETLIGGVKQNADMFNESEKTVKSQKIVIIILVILLVGAAAAITLLIFKVKDMADAQYFNEVENETLKRRSSKPQGGGQKVMQSVGGRAGGQRSGGASQGQRPQGSRPVEAAQGQRPQGSRPAGAPQGARPAGTSQGQQRPAAQGTRPAGASQGQQRPAPQGARPAGASQGQQRPAAQGQRPQGGRPAGNAQGQQSPGWQSKNFMADEDEFEFEFLNYEGDDQK